VNLTDCEQTLMILLKILNEKMKKVLFLMLFLLVLGAAGVKAQVRIGGNAVPNAAAALDLNATDATNNGTKGLALPRVNLTSNTMQLTTGITNLTGMLVYNTTATLGAGIYTWTGSTWRRVDAVPITTAADSGKFLKYNGSVWQTSFEGLNPGAVWYNADSIWPYVKQTSISWSLILDTSFTLRLIPGQSTIVHSPGMLNADMCEFIGGNSMWPKILWVQKDNIAAYTPAASSGIFSVRLRCYRPSV